MMNLTLTYDHRLIDGREAATFLMKVSIPRHNTLFSQPTKISQVKEYIQDPRRMLLA
jgi:hypothetical protein